MHGIRQLVDVRSTPASRFHPQFNQKRLEASLNEQGIDYVYLGDRLGGRPSDPSCYPAAAIPAKGKNPHPVPDFTEVMKRPWFQEGIQELLGLIPNKRTAILCSEEDPAFCHREALIAAYLRQTHPEITTLHIRSTGELQPG